MPEECNRREFLKYLLGWAAALFLEGCMGKAQPTVTPTPMPTLGPTPTLTPTATFTPTPKPSPAPTSTSTLTPTPTSTPTPTLAPSPTPTPLPPSAEIAIVRGKDWEAITRAAIEAIGGMKAFVKPGATVLLKPNICTAGRPPEYAATSHPIVVATVAKMCWEAGAKRVLLFDLPFSGTQEAAYKDSGIADAVKGLDVELLFASPRHYEKVPVPGRDLKEWTFLRQALEADVFINIPIAKHHSEAGLTLGMKNIMGVIQDRPFMHWNLHQRIADLNTVVRSHLVVVDATRILVAHGPQGGRLEDVRITDAVIASADVVAADALAATLFGKSWRDIGYIRIGAEMGLGLPEGRRLAEVVL